MRSMIPTLALACLASISAPLAAQAPDPPAPPHDHAGMMPMQHWMPGVAFFLAHTGDLQLTDGQVTKLAAIARRAEERHKAMRASFDSAAHMRGGPGMRGDTAGGGARRGEMMAAFKRAHDAEHADLRDALAVLTPDQQAKAWEIVAARHHHMMGMHHGWGMQGMHGKDGPGGWGPSMRDGHGPDGDSAGRGQGPPQ